MKTGRNNGFKEKIYCEFTEYIDECYICRLQGMECDLKFFPNRYECLFYCKNKKKVNYC